MKKIVTGITKAEEALMVLLMIAMNVIIFIATVARFTNLFVISWAEEFARYCMIWIIFLGIGVAANRGEHFCVQALELFVPKRGLQIIEVIKVVFTTGFCLFATFWGLFVIKKQIANGQVTPSLHWPMWLMYLAIPVGLFIMGFTYAYRSISNIKSIGDKPGSTAEAEGALAEAEERAKEENM